MLKMKRFNLVILLINIGLLLAYHGVKCEKNSLRIGAFNIQIFGQKKAANNTIMEILAKIIRRYDLILIQEIRDSSQAAIIKLLNKVNRNLSSKKRFEMVVSRRLGRTRSKEQYAFMFRPSSGLSIVDSFEFEDGNETRNHHGKYMDLFQREPFLINVKSQNTVPIEFIVIGIHVAPEQAVEEINHLEAVFEYVTNILKVPNVVVMGDLNADCSYVRKSDWKSISLRRNGKFKWYIGDEMDTTVKETHCAYDRFIFTGSQWSKGMIPLSARVYRFDNDIGLLGEMSKSLAISVSDHYPIEFKLFVSPVISISGIYVTLSPGRSLKRQKSYRLIGNTVIDDKQNIIGKLREQYNYESILIAHLQEIVTRGLHSETIVIDRLKRVYRGNQKTRLRIRVSAENAFEVRNILYHSCSFAKYKCT